MFSALIPGHVIGRIGYTPLFLVMSCLYMVAMFLFHILMRDLTPVRFESTASTER